MENKDVVYLGRVYGLHSAENFERFLQGESDVQLGIERGDVVVTEMVEGVDLSKASSPVETIKWQDNAKKTAEVNSYFFVADSMEDVANNIQILNNEPVDEAAYERIENHKNPNRFDYLGNGKVTMCVIAVDSSYLNELISQGYGEKRVGTYGTNLDKLQMDEIVLGDDGLKKIISNKEKSEIVVYDEIHKAMDFVGVEYDQANLFENDYIPEVVIQNNEKVAVSSDKTITQSFSESDSDGGRFVQETEESDEIARARQQIEDMLSNGLITEDDYNLMLDALGDIDIQKDNPSDDSGDDPDREM